MNRLMELGLQWMSLFGVVLDRVTLAVKMPLVDVEGSRVIEGLQALRIASFTEKSPTKQAWAAKLFHGAKSTPVIGGWTASARFEHRQKGGLTYSELLPASTKFTTPLNAFLTSSCPTPKFTMPHVSISQSQSQTACGDPFPYKPPVVKDYKSDLDNKPGHIRVAEREGTKNGKEKAKPERYTIEAGEIKDYFVSLIAEGISTD